MFEDVMGRLNGSESQTRASWGSNLEYYLSSIGFAVGFGSLWRFPYVVFSNGGGAFLIPYTIFFFILAFPLFYLESALGQTYQQSAPGCLEKAGKKFRGVGIAQMISSFCLGSFYNILMAYSLIFLLASFTTNLPWKTTADSSNPDAKFWDSSYFDNNILQRTDSISDLGGFNYPVLFASIVSFIIVYLCVAKGVETSGKVVYVSAPLPYLLLFILLFRGLLLDGAWDGIKYLFDVDWSKLWGIDIWYRAASQVLFQYSIGVACLHTLASYKEKHQSLIKSAYLIPIITACTGILCGLTVFAYMGHMAYVAKVSISDLPLQGPELVFVAYPAAITLMPGSTFWAILFFVMLYFLGIDTEFCFLETVGGFCEDEKIKVFGRTLKTEVMRILIVVGFFCVGLLLYTKAGYYFLSVYDDYIVVIPMTLSVVMECLIFGWIHGTDDLADLIRKNVQEEIPPYAIFSIKYLALPILSIMLIGSFVKLILINLWSLSFLAICVALLLTGLPVFAIVYYYVKYKNSPNESTTVENEIPLLVLADAKTSW